MPEAPGGEPIVELADLSRSFLVRTKAGRLRRSKRTVHAVATISATILAGESVGYIGRTAPASRRRSR